MSYIYFQQGERQLGFSPVAGVGRVRRGLAPRTCVLLLPTSVVPGRACKWFKPTEYSRMNASLLSPVSIQLGGKKKRERERERQNPNRAPVMGFRCWSLRTPKCLADRAGKLLVLLTLPGILSVSLCLCVCVCLAPRFPDFFPRIWLH